MHNEINKMMRFYDNVTGKIKVPLSVKKETSSRISSNMPSPEENKDINDKKDDIEKYFKGIYKYSNVVSVKKSKTLNSSIKKIDELLKFQPKSKNKTLLKHLLGLILAQPLVKL